MLTRHRPGRPPGSPAGSSAVSVPAAERTPAGGSPAAAGGSHPAGGTHPAAAEHLNLASELIDCNPATIFTDRTTCARCCTTCAGAKQV